MVGGSNSNRIFADIRFSHILLVFEYPVVPEPERVLVLVTQTPASFGRGSSPGMDLLKGEVFEANTNIARVLRYEKVREDGAVRSQAVLIAIGINWEGRRNILAVELAS